MSPNKGKLDNLLKNELLSLQTVWDEAFAQMSDSDAESILAILTIIDIIDNNEQTKSNRNY